MLGLRLSSRRLLALLVALLFAYLLVSSVSAPAAGGVPSGPVRPPAFQPNWLKRLLKKPARLVAQEVPYLRHALEPGLLVPAPDRLTDVSDAFDNFIRSPTCYLSSLDLHEPFEPLCETKDALLQAMSGGGRQGWNAPYMPRDCDMRWFSTQEVCDVLSRFSYVFLIGDSLIRHVTASLHTYMRADLYEGAYTSWKDRPPKGAEPAQKRDGNTNNSPVAVHKRSEYDCRCGFAFDNGGCFADEAWSSQEIWKHDPDSMQCAPDKTAFVEFSQQNSFPLSDDNKAGLRLALPKEKTPPQKPLAFVLGHGLWNNLEMLDAIGWINQILDTVHEELPWLHDPRADRVYRNSSSMAGDPNLRRPTADDALPELATTDSLNSHMHMLFMTPNAGGEGKPKIYEQSQGNLALQRFERAIAAYAQTQHGAMDVLGTWNLSIQSTSPDGTHAGWRADLLKGMMVLNWMDAVSGGMAKRVKAGV